MSSALDLAPEPRQALAALPFEIQEPTFDRHYVTIVYVRDTTAQTIRVRSIGHLAQSVPRT